MIAIIDYGAGNLFSVKNALDYIGLKNIITNNQQEIERADSIILPGVGAFPDAMNMLNQTNLVDVLINQAKKKPFLGICLGMQVLFEKGYEFSETKGLSLINGNVIEINANGYKIPHMGWNQLKKQNDCALLKGIDDGAFVYFVHSYRADTEDKNISAFTEYSEKIPALVYKNGIYGAQFHPEKSGEVGLLMLKNFGDLTK